MSSLIDKIKKNSTFKTVKTLDKSELLKDTDNIVTDMPVLNLAFSGELDKGFRSGLIQFAGPSKHFKTNLSLVCVRSFFDKYDEGICLFFDSEFGITEEYLLAQGIDPERVIHIPIMNIEELKFEIIAQLNGLAKEDKVIILIDSIGNLASKKEVEDAQNEKSVADMSRAKQLKSLFRMVTPYLTMKDIPLIAINHSYQTQEMYSKTVVSGGTGAMYSSNVVFVLGRQQDKDGKDLTGYTFVINIEKSREVREKSKLMFSVSFEGGINRYSGLLDIGLASGHVVSEKQGWYQRSINGQIQDQKFRKKDVENKEFWEPILKDDTFKEACKKIFKVSYIDNRPFETIVEEDYDNEEFTSPEFEEYIANLDNLPDDM